MRGVRGVREVRGVRGVKGEGVGFPPVSPFSSFNLGPDHFACCGVCRLAPSELAAAPAPDEWDGGGKCCCWGVCSAVCSVSQQLPGGECHTEECAWPYSAAGGVWDTCGVEGACFVIKRWWSGLLWDCV